jgi:serine/threonine-protein kinase
MDTDTAPQLFHALRDSGFYTPEKIAAAEQAFAAGGDDAQLADRLLAAGLLTPYQARKVRAGQSQTLLFGPYLILDKIGEGGMGKVYRAVQARSGRVVALKIVRPHLISNRTVHRRYQREAKAAAALDHPNIVKLFDADEVNGRYYLAMEYVDGIDLARMVKQFGRPPESGLPQYQEACEYVRQAALGLQHAHDRGLVHRDVKPSNILVCGDRALPGTQGKATVKILDMGLVRTILDVDPEGPQTELTRDGTVVGTPEYMSPEQAKDSRTVDNRADLYSLGCTLFYLLKGHSPFPDGTPIDKLLRHQLDPPPDLRRQRPDVPAGVIEVVEKLLRKDPADRFPNAAAVASALAPYTPGGDELSALVATPAPPVHEPFSFTSDPDAIAREPVKSPPSEDRIPYATVVTVAASGTTTDQSIPEAEAVGPPPRPSRTVPPPTRPASPVPRATTASADGTPSSGTLMTAARAAGRPIRGVPGATPTAVRRRDRGPAAPVRRSSRKRVIVIAGGVIAGVLALIALLALALGGGHTSDSQPTSRSGPDTKSPSRGVDPPLPAPPPPTPAVPAQPPVRDLVPDRSTAVLVVRPTLFTKKLGSRTSPGGRLSGHLDHLGSRYHFDPRQFDRGVLAFVGLTGLPVAIGEGPFLTPEWVAGLDKLPGARPAAVGGQKGYVFADPARHTVVLGTRAYALSPDAKTLADLATRYGAKRPPERVSPDLLGSLSVDTTPDPPLATFAAGALWEVPGGDKTSLVQQGVRTVIGTVRWSGEDLEFELVLSGRDRTKLQVFVSNYLGKTLIERHPGLRPFTDVLVNAHHEFKPIGEDFVELHVRGRMTPEAFLDGLEKILSVPVKRK